PREARPAGAAARLVVRLVGAVLRVVGLLRLPRDDAVLDVDLPRAGAGAVDAVGGAHHPVVRPPLAVGRLPVAAAAGRAAEAARARLDPAEEPQRVTSRRRHAGCRAAPDR